MVTIGSRLLWLLFFGMLGGAGSPRSTLSFTTWDDVMGDDDGGGMMNGGRRW